MIEILHRYTKACLYKSEKATLREAVIEAVENDASLNGASLNCAIGNKRQIKSLQIHKWNVAYTVDDLFIGC